MEFDDYMVNNSKNLMVESDIPDVTKSEKCILGVDEAGRGPVLGPMVYGIAFCPLSKADELKALGFADSKTLSEGMREKLFSTINENNDYIGWKTEIISPNFISNSMLKRAKYNLNALSHDAAIKLIQKAVDDGALISEVYVDTVGDPKKYQDKLSSIFPGIKITVAKKADATYPIVSAASICAKVGRDRTLKDWKFVEGGKFSDIKYGSGYPADPVTKSFIADNVDKIFGYPQLVRFSWSTADTVLQKKAVDVTWSDDEDDADSKPSSLLNYFGKRKLTEVKPPMSHVFYKERGLHPVSSLDL